MEDPVLVGCATAIVFTLLLRRVVARYHRKGIQLVKRKQYAEAIPYFEKSVDFFSRNKWVDKYRFITLLSSSAYTYKEMGLCNIAFCYSQIGNGVKAREYYESTLKEFPENGMAIAGMNMVNSFKEQR